MRRLLLALPIAALAWYIASGWVFLRTARATTLPALIGKCATNQSGSSVTNINCALSLNGSPVNSNTNDLINVTCEVSQTGETITATDDAPTPNTYTAAAPLVTGGNSNDELTRTFWAIVTSGGGTTLHPKCQFNNATTAYNEIDTEEFSGLATSTPVDSEVTATPTPAANVFFNSTAANTPTATNTLVYSYCAANNVLSNSGPGYQLLNYNSGDIDEYKLYFNTGSQQAQFLNNSDNGGKDACVLIAYKFADQTANTAVYINNSAGLQQGSTSTTWTVAILVGGGSNGLVTCGLHYVNGLDSPTTVKLDATTAFTQDIHQADVSSFMSLDTWSLKAVSAGTHNVNITFNTTRTGWAFCTDFANVNQTTPIAGVQSDKSTTTPITKTITSATGDMVMAYVDVDAQPVCLNSPGVMDFNNNWSSADLPSPMFGHFAGAATVTVTETEIQGGFPSFSGPTPIVCPGTTLTVSVQESILGAFDIQVAAGAGPPANQFPRVQ